jgi:hypothetical protein
LLPLALRVLLQEHALVCYFASTLGRGDVGTARGYDDALGQETSEAVWGSCTATEKAENYQKAVLIVSALDFLNNGDTERFVRNSDNGVLLEYGLLPQLPSVIKALLADERRREALGANAKRFAEENFWTWEERIDAEVTAVPSLLERKSSETKQG